MSWARLASLQMGTSVRACSLRSAWSTAVAASLATNLMDLRVVTSAPLIQNGHQVHQFSSSSSSSGFPRRGSGGPPPFKVRRRPPKNYHPFISKDVKPRRPTYTKHLLHLGNKVPNNPKNELEETYGPQLAVRVRSMQRNRRVAGLLAQNDPEDTLGYDTVEESLRAADYMLSERGSTEEAIFERRVLEHYTDEEREAYEKNLDYILKEGEKDYLKFEDMTLRTDLKPPKERYSKELKKYLDGSEEEILYGWNDEDPANRYDPMCQAHGNWSEYLVSVNRGVHNWRGGRIQSFRAMVVGGNGNGCAGFAVGKGKTAMDAINEAGRKSRHNIFFVDRYMGERLTRDLVGRHNDCKVVIRTQTDKEGLRGNIMVREILKRFGVVHAQCKAHGKRRPVWNVVYATFKALMQHESLEEICRKRGKRFVPLDRALRSGTGYY